MVVPMTGQQRQQQEDETDGHRREGVAPEQPVVAQEDEDERRDHHRDSGPDQLAAGVAVDAGAAAGEVEPVDHHQPEPVEQRGDRQQQGVGVGGAPTDHEMERQREPEQAAADGEQLRRDRLADAEVDADPGQQGDADGEDGEQQLDPATGARRDRLDGGPHGVEPRRQAGDRRASPCRWATPAPSCSWSTASAPTTGFWPHGMPAVACARQSVAEVRNVSTRVLASARLPQRGTRADDVLDVGRQLADRDVGHQVDAGQVDGADVLADALPDGDVAVGGLHEVLVLGPGVGRVPAAGQDQGEGEGEDDAADPDDARGARLLGQHRAVIVIRGRRAHRAGQAGGLLGGADR